MKKSHRKLIVFSTLLGVLSLTSALLTALAPAPLVRGAATSLFAVDEPRSMDVVFETKDPVANGRWKYVYIHHSQTASGNAFTLGQASAGGAGAAGSVDGIGDHFVIGNGDGAVDGEIQITQRWNHQQTALPPAGTTVQAGWSDCISICVVGDFDRTIPTSTQLRRLAQLVNTLQGQLHIGQDSVLLLDTPDAAASVGRYFPRSAFRGQLLP